MDPACLPALALLRLTTAVLELGERVAAGDEGAAAEAAELSQIFFRISPPQLDTLLGTQ